MGEFWQRGMKRRKRIVSFDLGNPLMYKSVPTHTHGPGSGPMKTADHKHPDSYYGNLLDSLFGNKSDHI